MPENADYRVEVYEPDGETRISETAATDWKHCLTIVQSLAAAHPGKVVSAYNAETCDCDDGLTDAEREAVVSAVAEARGE